MKPRKKLGVILVEAEFINEEQLQAALDHQKRWGGRLGKILVELDFLSEHDLFRMLAKHLDLPIVDLGIREVQQEALVMVDANMARHHKLLPIGLKSTPTGRVLHVAMSDPTDMDALNQLQTLTGARIVPLITEPAGLHAAIEKHYGRHESSDAGPAKSLADQGKAVPEEADIPVVVGELLPVAAQAQVEVALSGGWGAQTDLPAEDDADPALNLPPLPSWDSQAIASPRELSCPSCQATRIAGARFCAQCGHHLSDAPSTMAGVAVAQTPGHFTASGEGQHFAPHGSPAPFGPQTMPSGASLPDVPDATAPSAEGFLDPFAPTPTVTVDVGGADDFSAGEPSSFFGDSPAAPSERPMEELPLGWADALDMPLPQLDQPAETAPQAGAPADTSQDPSDAVRTPPWAAISDQTSGLAEEALAMVAPDRTQVRERMETMPREKLLRLCLRLYERDAITVDELEELFSA